MAKDREEFNIPENAAWALLICIVGFFAIATGVQFIMTVEKNMLFRSLIRPSDIFLSARQQAGWYAIGISFMASGLGAWIIYGTTELGATRPISWWGVLGYSTASAMPAILICFLGPLIRKKVGAEKGFSATDFALSRYGRLMHLQVSAISCFYMYIYLVAELTTIGNVYATMIGKDITGTESESYTTRIAIALIVATWAYTALGGLPASIFTDKFQGIIIAAVVTMLLFATTTVKRNRVSRSEFNDGTGWFSKGFEVLVTLWIAILSAEMFNQGTWQRVFAAKSDKDMRLGFAFGALLVCIIMLFFGIMGMLAYSNDRESYDTFQKLAYLSFFDLLLPLDRTWHFLFLALLTTLAASSVDTLQNGLAAVLSQDLVKHHLSANWSRLIVIGFNIAAVIQAAERFEVVPLFLVADLVCATSVFPLFLGLIQHDIPIFSGRFFIPAPTELGAFLGCLSGLAAVIINGRINDVHRAVNFYTGKVYERNPNLAYFWLTNTKADGTPYECALCGSKTMHTFIAVPLIAAAATFFFSKLDLMLGGDRARQPFLIIPRLDAVTAESQGGPIEANKSSDNIQVKQFDEELIYDHIKDDEAKERFKQRVSLIIDHQASWLLFSLLHSIFFLLFIASSLFDPTFYL